MGSRCWPHIICGVRMKLKFLKNGVLNGEIVFHEGEVYEISNELGSVDRWFRRGIVEEVIEIEPAKEEVIEDKVEEVVVAPTEEVVDAEGEEVEEVVKEEVVVENTKGKRKKRGN